MVMVMIIVTVKVKRIKGVRIIKYVIMNIMVIITTILIMEIIIIKANTAKVKITVRKTSTITISYA